MRLWFSALLALSVVACVTPVSMPQAPAVSSPAGESCIEDCVTGYAQCELPCGGQGSASRRVPACQKECYEQLDACYSKCPSL